MRILVCGGRNFAIRTAVVSALERAHAKRGITLLISGGAPGADSLAAEWAEAEDIEQRKFPADWKGLGRRAGPIRNQRMIDEGKPDAVVAFPGSSGTADMIRRAEAAGLKVWRPYG